MGNAIEGCCRGKRTQASEGDGRTPDFDRIEKRVEQAAKDAELDRAIANPQDEESDYPQIDKYLDQNNLVKERFQIFETEDMISFDAFMTIQKTCLKWNKLLSCDFNK